MEIFQGLESIANTYPILFVVVIIILTLVPKTLDYLTKRNTLQFETTDTMLDKIGKRLETVQDRGEKLEKELDMWREKYYSLKNELILLEVENKKLIAEIDRLKKIHKAR